MRRQNFIAAIITAFSLFPFLNPVKADNTMIYWDTVRGGIKRMNADGTGKQDVISYTGMTNYEALSGLAIDSVAGKMYWTYSDNSHNNIHKIKCANIDGSQIQDFLAGGTTGDFAIDSLNRRLYWTTGEQIGSVNLNGSNPSYFGTDNMALTCDVDIDTAAGKLYWSENWEGVIMRSNLDGSQQEVVDLAGGTGFPTAIALDTVHNRIYTVSGETLLWSNLDGSDYHDIYSFSGDYISDIACDSYGGKVYWSTYDTIYRANLDGSNIETLATDTYIESISIVTVPEPATLLLLGLGGLVLRKRK